MINSLGPYNHSEFEYKGLIVSHEGPLAGREKFLKQSAYSELERICFEKELKRNEIRILEIGSYNGSIANFLYNSGFRKITTFESRKHNIARGKALRKMLGQRDRVRHKVVDIEKISNLRRRALRSKFDAVLCFGVLHHVQNPHRVLKELSNFLNENGLLLLETLVLNDSLQKREFKFALEPKDILYRNENSKVGFFGIKKESNYFPGSTSSQSVTTIPSISGLELFLEDVGIMVAAKGVGWEKTIERRQLNHRSQIMTTLISGVKVKRKDPVFDAAESYENVFCLEAVSQDKVQTLLQSIDNQEIFESYLTSFILKSSAFEREILESIRFSAKTKLLFENAKNLLMIGKVQEGTEQLESIVRDGFCPDWRTAYRSLYLLSLVKTKVYRKHAIMCHPEFPKSTLRKMELKYRNR